MTHEIELGFVNADGITISRPYKDIETGDRGFIAVSFTSSSVRVYYLDGSETPLQLSRVEVDDLGTAERTITEEFAAVEAIGSVLDRTHGPATA